jgi:hypothetical protein
MNELVISAVNQSSITRSDKYSRKVLCALAVTQPCSLNSAVFSLPSCKSLSQIGDNNNGKNFCVHSGRFVTGSIEGLFYSFYATFPQ